MKSKYKYIILILVTCLTSILIYNYVESFTSVDTYDDVLTIQSNQENAFLSSTDYTIDNPNVVLDPYGVSPLTALVVFETKDLTSVTLTVKGRDDDNDIVNTFIPSKLHLIPVYGLYADYNNTVIISTGDESKTLKIKTKALPDGIKNASSTSSLDTDDFYFTTYSDFNYPIAYDRNGNVRWVLLKNYGWEFTRLSNGHILLSGDSLVNKPYYSDSLVEIDLLGKIYTEYNVSGGYHHCVYELSSGNLLVASNNFEGGTVEDYIVEIDRSTGEIIKKFDLYNLMPNDSGYDWFGLNGLFYDAKTNSITVSGGKKNFIMNIDYTSGEINYIIASSDSVSKKYKKYLLKTDDDFVYPKNPETVIQTDDGIAFINRDSSNHLIEYKIDGKNAYMALDIDLDSSGDGSLSYNKDLGFVISQGSKVSVYSDSVLDVLNVSSSLYSAKLLNVYAGDSFTSGAGNRVGILPESDLAINHSVFFHKTSDSIYSKYDLKLYKDVNRLTVTGTFKKSDDVQIILDNILDKKTYDVKISDTPYIKDDKNGDNAKIKTETYINETGLNGKYYIYIKINGVVYKLNKFVYFNN